MSSEGGKPLRMVGTFTDISERKHKEEQIKYLSFHDKMTGLYNRAFYEEELNRLDTERQLPISVIIGDVNGLKLANDVFGYEAGDQLLIEISKIIKEACRSEDVIARWGGDEFAIILPKTEESQALEVCKRINELCAKVLMGPVKASISLGTSTKYHASANIKKMIKKAEERLYRNKLLESKSARSEIISSLQKTLFERTNETEKHCQRMQKIGGQLGKMVGLDSDERGKLDLLILLHDIGKIAIADSILNKPGELTEEEWEEIKKHPTIGYRIAESSLKLFHISDYILYHHERWDGKGYPRGLKGEEIPKLSRIIAVLDTFEVMTHDRAYKKKVSEQEAMEEIEKCAGTQFDPKIVQSFLSLFDTQSEVG